MKNQPHESRAALGKQANALIFIGLGLVWVLNGVFWKSPQMWVLAAIALIACATVAILAVQSFKTKRGLPWPMVVGALAALDGVTAYEVQLVRPAERRRSDPGDERT